MDPIEHHPPHRDGWYEDDQELRFVVTIRKRPGFRLGPNDHDTTLPIRDRRGPNDFGRIRGAIFKRAYPEGLPRKGDARHAPIEFDPATMLDVNTSANPRYLPKQWRDRGPSINDPSPPLPEPKALAPADIPPGWPRPGQVWTKGKARKRIDAVYDNGAMDVTDLRTGIERRATAGVTAMFWTLES